MIIVLKGETDHQTQFLRHLYKQNTGEVFLGDKQDGPLNKKTPSSAVVYIKDAHMYENKNDVIGSAVKWGCNKVVYMSVDDHWSHVEELYNAANFIIEVKSIPPKSNLRVV